MENRYWKDLVTIISGKNQKQVANPNGQYPIYGSGGIMGYADDYLCEAGTTIVGRKGTINNPIFVDEPFWNVDTAFGISPGKDLIPQYLYYFCKGYNFKQLDKSTTIPSLAKRDLLNIEMPVPSLAEQERIVARIEELFSQLDNGIETLQKIKQQLEVYRQAVLQNIFTGSFPRIRLDNISKYLNGYAFKSKKYINDGKYTVVKIGNVKDFHFDFSRDYTLTNEADTPSILEKSLLQEGDCVITLTGTRGKRDYGFITRVTTQKNYVLNQRVAALRFNPKVADSRFYQYYLSSPEYRNFFFSYETGNVGQGNVGVKALTEPYVIFPPIESQIEIVQKIESQLSVCNDIAASVTTALQQADALRQSILKKAFEGNL